MILDDSDIKGDTSETQIKFDYLVIGVGAQNSTFGIPGVDKHACFLKEVWDATKIRTRIMVPNELSWILIVGLYRDCHIRKSDSRGSSQTITHGCRRWRTNWN